MSLLLLVDDVMVSPLIAPSRSSRDLFLRLDEEDEEVESVEVDGASNVDQARSTRGSGSVEVAPLEVLPELPGLPQ